MEITAMSEQYRLASLELIETVFTEYDGAAEGKKVRKLTEEIRSKKYYIPELELIMKNGEEIVGYAMFSRFHIEERYENELLILTPVAVPKIHLPHPDCLMIKELKKSALENIKGVVDYSFYETLSE